MTVKALIPVRTVNLVAPLAHKATDMHPADTAAPVQARSGAIALIAALAYFTGANASFDYECGLCYDSNRSKEHGIGVPVARRNKPRLIGQRLFSCATHGSIFGGPCGGTRKSAPVLARYANPARSASCDWRRGRQVYNLSLGAIMANTTPLGARASTVPVSSYRHENWRMEGPPPLIINPCADLHALLAWCWGEARDTQAIICEFLVTNDSTAEDLASILFSRIPALVNVLEFLANESKAKNGKAGVEL